MIPSRLVTFLALAGVSLAQSVEELPLRPSVPSKEPAQSVEEVVYRHNNFDDRGLNRAVQKVAVPTLTIYRPAKTAHRGAAIVICPGGGYAYIAIDREGHALGRYFSARGITVAVLKYRLPDAEAVSAGLPRSQQDGLEAVRFVRARAAEWGVDPKRIGILGGSAGGHLAGSVGILGRVADGSRPDFVALLYPVVMMDGPHAHKGSRTRLLGAAPSAERVNEFSLELRARPDLPPFFLVHAKDDAGVPHHNSEALVSALKAQRVPAELLLIDKGGHGFGLGRGPGSDSEKWMAAFLGWLDRLP